MASKVFTAQELRQRADEEERHWNDHVTAAMLRQAADALEREEKREKRYEYASVINGVTYNFHYDDLNKALKPRLVSGEKLIRRSVGEWEEVRDGE